MALGKRNRIRKVGPAERLDEQEPQCRCLSFDGARPERHWTHLHMSSMAELLVQLPSLDRAGLRALWQKSFGRPPSPRLRRELMLPILAFRLQEISNGGLTGQTQMRLREVIDSLPLN